MDTDKGFVRYISVLKNEKTGKLRYEFFNKDPVKASEIITILENAIKEFKKHIEVEDNTSFSNF